MLSVLAFVIAIFAIVIAIVLLADQPTGARVLLAVAGIAVFIGVCLAAWGEQRWDNCTKNSSGNYYESAEFGDGFTRCPDKLLGLRSPF